ncbi:Exportin-6 [Desmophyllum pertusum]|uniref:Exportin-6 n=1 Tax=Desmophyllum pertusum TaxID=174260 RepID=A0A9W9YQ27_9CNID|nr:Exportin-6 [Desmophyllum pertusum]
MLWVMQSLVSQQCRVSMNCLSKNCVPVEFEEFLLNCFNRHFSCLQRITKDTGPQAVENLLTEQDEKLFCNFTEFLRLFKIQFRHNHTQLEELDDIILDDDCETEWQAFQRNCLEIVAKFSQNCCLERLSPYCSLCSVSIVMCTLVSRVCEKIWSWSAPQYQR